MSAVKEKLSVFIVDAIVEYNNDIRARLMKMEQSLLEKPELTSRELALIRNGRLLYSKIDENPMYYGEENRHEIWERLFEDLQVFIPNERIRLEAKYARTGRPSGYKLFIDGRQYTKSEFARQYEPAQDVRMGWPSVRKLVQMLWENGHIASAYLEDADGQKVWSF